MNTRYASRLQPWNVDAVGVVVILVVGAVCYLLLAEPLMERRGTARAQAVDLGAKREMLARTRAARQESEVRLVNVKAAVSAQSVQLESRTHVNKRLDALTRLAAESGIAVGRLAPGPTADGARHGTMTLLLTGKGGLSLLRIVRDAAAPGVQRHGCHPAQDGERARVAGAGNRGVRAALVHRARPQSCAEIVRDSLAGRVRKFDAS